jgi:hypothetical protein
MFFRSRCEHWELMLAIHLNKELSLLCIYGIYRNSLSHSIIYTYIWVNGHLSFFPISSSTIFCLNDDSLPNDKIHHRLTLTACHRRKKNVFLPSGMLKGSFSSVTFCFTSLFLLLYYHVVRGEEERLERKRQILTPWSLTRLAHSPASAFSLKSSEIVIKAINCWNDNFMAKCNYEECWGMYREAFIKFPVFFPLSWWAKLHFQLKLCFSFSSEQQHN